MAVERNLDSERQAIGKFQSMTGRSPSTSEDWRKIHLYSYPTKELLPDEFKAESGMYDNVPDTASSSSVRQFSSTPLGQSQQQQAALQADVNAARGVVDTTQAAKQAGEVGQNTMFQTLQNALRIKGAANDGGGIGESDIFKQAGLTSHDNIFASLNARGTEIDSNRQELGNMVNMALGNERANAQVLSNNYNNAANRYTDLVTQLNKTNSDLLNYQQQMDSIKLQHSLANESDKWGFVTMEVTDPETGTVIKTPGKFNKATGQYEPIEASIPTGAKTVVSGEHVYDLTTYATDPEHAKGISKILDGIGKFNNPEDIDAYIKKYFPDSPITSQMVQEASGKYGLPWEMIVALLQQESGIGTKGVGVKTMNPGNVGNTDSGATQTFANWQEGVNAAAEQIAKREVAVPEGYFNVNAIKGLVGSGAKGYISKDMAASFKKGIDEAMRTGGWPAAYQYAKTFFYGKMSNAERNKLNLDDTQIVAIDKALGILDRPGQPPEVGPWNSIAEKSIKPWLGMDKDKADTELNFWVEYGQAALRNGLFGSQLTEGELALSRNFLIDTRKDDINTIKTKLKNLKDLAQFHQDMAFAKEMGIKTEDVPKPAGYFAAGTTNVGSQPPESEPDIMDMWLTKNKK